MRRSWIPPLVNLVENDVGPFPKHVVKVHSDRPPPLRYSLSGGPLLDLFAVNPVTGHVTVAGALDREQHSHIQLWAHAWSVGAGLAREVEPPVALRMRVIDVNDHAPVFAPPTTLQATPTTISATPTTLQATPPWAYVGRVTEGSPAENKVGLHLLSVPVVDRDEVNSSNWRATFHIVQGNEGGHFAIHTHPLSNHGLLTLVKVHPATGALSTRAPLDRESSQVSRDLYNVTLLATDN
ncbi:unnamed protein product, partial [Lampetra fluviatilis]